MLARPHTVEASLLGKHGKLHELMHIFKTLIAGNAVAEFHIAILTRSLGSKNLCSCLANSSPSVAALVHNRALLSLRLTSTLDFVARSERVHRTQQKDRFD
jgi:hypothetical protein